MRRLTGAITLTAALAWAGAAAALPLQMPLQGVVMDNAGTPVASGAFAVTYALYDSPTGEVALWTESHPADGHDCVADPGGCVAVEQGVFSVQLGVHEPLTPQLFAEADALWLGLKVEGDPELSRRPLGSSPWALHAASAGTALGLACSGCVGADALAADVIDQLAAAVPAPELDAVSNGTLTNVFTRDHATGGLPVGIGTSVDVILTVAEPGQLRELTVAFEIGHPFLPEAEVRLIPPAGGAGIVLTPAGSAEGASLSATVQWSSLLADGGTLADALAGTDPAGTWLLRVTDTLVNGNEGPGEVLAFSLTVTYLSAAEVGIKLADGSVALMGPAQSAQLQQLGDRVTTLEAKLWCLENCDAAKIGDCTNHTCDGLAQSCLEAGALPDGTSCAGGIGACVSGSCCIASTCTDLSVECGQHDNGCGGVVSCGGCGAGTACDEGVCVEAGSTPESAGASCLALRELGAVVSKGYWIKPPAFVDPVHVYCDMISDGGGWTLCYANAKSYSTDHEVVGWHSKSNEGVYEEATYSRNCKALDDAVQATLAKLVYVDNVNNIVATASPPPSLDAAGFYTYTKTQGSYDIGIEVDNPGNPGVGHCFDDGPEDNSWGLIGTSDSCYLDTSTGIGTFYGGLQKVEYWVR